MSGEFGSYSAGYLHRQIERAAEDCADGRLEITRLWGKVFEIIHPVARGICWAEECDTSESDPCEQTVEWAQKLRLALNDCFDYSVQFLAQERLKEAQP